MALGQPELVRTCPWCGGSLQAITVEVTLTDREEQRQVFPVPGLCCLTCPWWGRESSERPHD
jgi:hypothetical protein